jgi:hypothetical protein
VDNLSVALRPARQPGESFDEYKVRRAGVNLAVKNHLRGRFAFISSRIVTLPAAGEDEKVDDKIRLRLYRDPVEKLDAKQKPYRVARTKGTTAKHRPKWYLRKEKRGEYIRRRREAIYAAK